MSEYQKELLKIEKQKEKEREKDARIQKNKFIVTERGRDLLNEWSNDELITKLLEQRMAAEKKKTSEDGSKSGSSPQFPGSTSSKELPPSPESKKRTIEDDYIVNDENNANNQNAMDKKINLVLSADTEKQHKVKKLIVDETIEQHKRITPYAIRKIEQTCRRMTNFPIKRSLPNIFTSRYEEQENTQDMINDIDNPSTARLPDNQITSRQNDRSISMYNPNNLSRISNNRDLYEPKFIENKEGMILGLEGKINKLYQLEQQYHNYCNKLNKGIEKVYQSKYYRDAELKEAKVPTIQEIQNSNIELMEAQNRQTKYYVRKQKRTYDTMKKKYANQWHNLYLPKVPTKYRKEEYQF